MTSTQDSPDKPEKPDDSDHVTDAEIVEIEDESSEDAPVLLDGEAEDVTEDLLELEDFSEETPESEAIPESFPPAEPVVERASAWPMVFGGLVAGAIGFGAGYLVNPGIWGQADDVARVQEVSDQTATEVKELTAQVDALGASIAEGPDTSGLEAGVAALDGTVAKITSQVADLAQTVTDGRAETANGLTELTSGQAELTTGLTALRERVAALEVESGNTNSAQADEAAAQLSAFQGDLEKLVTEAEARIVAAEEKAQAILAEAQAAAQATEAEAAERADLAEKQATLAELKTAVDAGASFTDLVAALDDVPAELAQHADSGVPTLVALQQTFAPAARSALATSQTIPDDASTGERLTAFLRRQTNARSLAPKDGNDTDAVLSRAEAYLSEGKLNETLSEVSALPEEAQSAMSGWLTDAQTRQAALQAVDALSANLN